MMDDDDVVMGCGLCVAWKTDGQTAGCVTDFELRTMSESTTVVF